MQIRAVIATVLLASFATTAHAVKVADITRIGGQWTNLLTGLGLVYGLKGTGDGGDFQPAIKPLATMLGKFSNPTTAMELQDVENVALVSITATVPSNGVRDGDKIDLFVTSIGAASSLRGGRLFVTPLTGPIPDGGIFALGEGPIVLEDPSTPTVGRIVGGAVMETDLPAKYIENGRFTLIVEDPSASWTTASTIAKIINDAEGNGDETLATAIDPKNIIVNIPPIERGRPDSFISRVQRLPVPILPSEARVTVNDRTGTMIVSGEVEISPCVISHKGLTISTITPPPIGTPQKPVITESGVIALDPSSTGGAKLQDLVNALDQLKVPAEDRIAIIKELHKIGKLHSKLIVEGS